MAATTAACLVLLCSQHIAAQDTRVREPSTELGLSAGVGQSMRRDLSASPLDFAGHGGDLAVALRRTTGHSTIEVSLNGESRSLRSASTVSHATERVGQGILSVAVLRDIGDRGISVGPAISTDIMLTRHAYDDPTHRSSDFVFGAASLGAAAAWRAPVVGGLFDARLIVPLASIVEHSYSVVNEHDAATNWQFATPNIFRSATTTFAYTTTAKRRVGLTWIYRVDLLRYDDVQPVRTLTHSLSFGVVTRWGSSSRTP